MSKGSAAVSVAVPHSRKRVRHVAWSTPPSRSSLLTAADVPQANLPKNVIAAVERCAIETDAGSAVNSHCERELITAPDYYAFAARALGFLSPERTLTDEGRALLSLPENQRMHRFALAFASSRVAREWEDWSGCDTLAEVDPATAMRFLAERSCLAKSVIKRRAQTLRAWIRTALPLFPDVNGSSVVLPPAWRVPEDLEPDVFESGRSGKVIRELARRAHCLRIATGYFTINGFERLTNVLNKVILKLLVGSTEAEVDVNEVIRHFVASIETGLPTAEKAEAVKRLHCGLVSGSTQVSSFLPRKKGNLHAKVYIFDEVAAYVTSANLTTGGFNTNIEGGSVITDPDRVLNFCDQFDDLFATAEDLLRDLLPAVERTWPFQPLADPYILYLRVLMELFGKAPKLPFETPKNLAPFQEMIVSEALQKMRDRRGALLIAPTGTGKTIMGSYIAACLREEGLCRRVWVVAPPSLEQKWSIELRPFKLWPRFVSSAILQLKGRTNVQAVRDLLKETDPSDLVIVDECHEFRNKDTNGFEYLSGLLKVNGRDRPFTLLLTATPMSKGLEDLNNLLSLVRADPVQTVPDIASCREAVNINLHDIYDRFSEVDGRSQSRCLQFPNEKRYFPDISYATEHYRSSMDGVFSLIRDMDLRCVSTKTDDPTQLRLEALCGENDHPSTFDAAFVRLILMLRAESSPLALQKTVKNLLSAYKTWDIQPVDPDRFRNDLRNLAKFANTVQPDEKFDALQKMVVAQPPDSRLLIFTSYADTAEYLCTRLSELVRDRSIGLMDGSVSRPEREHIGKCFSPVANGKQKRRRKDDIHVLIATNVASYGVDLQDATLLVNYDLFWTPLVLIQRAGRIDRPTLAPRDARVVNFYPGNSLFDELVKLRARLKERSSQYKLLARTDVVEDHERDLRNISSDYVAAVRDLYSVESYGDLLPRYTLPTTLHIQTLAAAGKEELREAERLPTGSRSARYGQIKTVFALVKYEKQLHCLSRASSSVLLSSPEHETHARVISTIASRPGEPYPTRLPEDYDAQVADLVNDWCKERRIDPNNVSVIGSEVTVPRDELDNPT